MNDHPYYDAITEGGFVDFKTAPMLMSKPPTSFEKVRAGELNSVFAKHGEFVDYGGRVEYGPIWIWPKGNLIEVKNQRPQTGWFDLYESLSYSRVKHYWNKSMRVRKLGTSTHGSVPAGGFEKVYCNGVYLFDCPGSLFTTILGRLRTVGVERVRIMTFGNPFHSDEDRLAYFSEWA